MTKQAAEDANLANASKVFIGWLSQQSGSWAEAGMIPARNSAREERRLHRLAAGGADDQLEHLHFLPAVPGLGDITPQTVEVAVNEAVLGKAVPGGGARARRQEQRHAS